MSKLTWGVGTNDGARQQILTRDAAGKVIRLHTDPIYMRWSGMLQRCYSDKWLEKHPSYRGCLVCDDWKRLSNFSLWAKSRIDPLNIVHYDLDKDILFPESKVYSPETCAFVPSWLNRSLVRRPSATGLLGVRERKGRYAAQIFTNGIKRHLGTFDNPEEAHEVWKKEKKSEIIRLTAKYEQDIFYDKRVALRLEEIIALVASDKQVSWLL